MRILGFILLVINLTFLLGATYYFANFSYFRNVLAPLPIFPLNSYFILCEITILVALGISLFKSKTKHFLKLGGILNILVNTFSSISFLVLMVWFLTTSSFIDNPTFAMPDLHTDAGYATIYNSILILNLLNVTGLFIYFLRQVIKR